MQIPPQNELYYGIGEKSELYHNNENIKTRRVFLRNLDAVLAKKLFCTLGEFREQKPQEKH